MLNASFERNAGSFAQRGAMLLEALIGILIFSMGILALVGLQAVSLKNTAEAKSRSDAAFLANQIIGQMWVDRANLAKYDDADGGHAPRIQWDADVAALLPGTNLTTPVAPATRNPSILVSAASGNMVTVTIQWRQPGESTDRKVQMSNWING